jgi:hypothetical protein
LVENRKGAVPLGMRLSLLVVISVDYNNTPGGLVTAVHWFVWLN